MSISEAILFPSMSGPTKRSCCQERDQRLLDIDQVRWPLLLGPQHYHPHLLIAASLLGSSLLRLRSWLAGSRINQVRTTRVRKHKHLSRARASRDGVSGDDGAPHGGRQASGSIPAYRARIRGIYLLLGA